MYGEDLHEYQTTEFLRSSLMRQRSCAKEARLKELEKKKLKKNVDKAEKNPKKTEKNEIDYPKNIGAFLDDSIFTR